MRWQHYGDGGWPSLHGNRRKRVHLTEWDTKCSKWAIGMQMGESGRLPIPKQQHGERHGERRGSSLRSLVCWREKC